jgi:hypothetical protein
MLGHMTSRIIRHMYDEKKKRPIPNIILKRGLLMILYIKIGLFMIFELKRGPFMILAVHITELWENIIKYFMLPERTIWNIMRSIYA